ncbi:MAG: hemerythrin domain-containing protein [Acidimicrobiales bacterium]
MTEVGRTGPGTTTGEGNEEVRAAIVAHHTGLVAGLEERVTAAEEAVELGAGAELELGAMVDYLEAEVIPHAEAEEAALYPLARTGELGTLVRAMVSEHAWLRAEARGLVGARGVGGAARARAIAAVFALHADKENDLLLPILAVSPGVDLALVLAAMVEHLAKPAVARGGPDAR